MQEVQLKTTSNPKKSQETKSKKIRNQFLLAIYIPLSRMVIIPIMKN